MVTIQFEVIITRRGQMTTTVKEKSFKSQEALERWAEKMAGNITILRYLAEEK